MKSQKREAPLTSEETPSLRHKMLMVIIDHWVLLSVFVSAAVVWVVVFGMAAAVFVNDGPEPFRAAWNGVGEINLFGFTLPLRFEGWADYDYYYVSWADQFLVGIMPYSHAFEYHFVDAVEYHIPYFFPPCFLYVCALGRILPLQPFGIGLVLSLFGYFTALPIYGIAENLSGNKHVGEISAAVYLFNPLVLYYTTYEWLNPAPFVFFAMLSFYLAITGHRVAAALAMVTSALFKQTAFFLGIPLIAYLLKVPPQTAHQVGDTVSEDQKRPAGDRLDLRGFVRIAAVVILYAGALSMPYLFDPVNYVYYVFQRVGATLLTDLTHLPPATNPITLAVVFIVLGAPEWLTQSVNLATYYTVGLLVGLLPIMALMLLEVKDDRNIKGYWRKLLFLSLMMMLWVHLFSPRGIYKYYTVALLPFFSVLSTSAMCSKESTEVHPSLWMVLIPFILSLLILIPDRNVYLIFLLIAFVAYALHSQFSLVNSVFRTGGGLIRKRVRNLHS